MRFSLRFRRNARSPALTSTTPTCKLDEKLLSDSGIVKSDDLSTCVLRAADVTAGVVSGVPVVGSYLGGGMKSLVHQVQDSAGTVDAAIALHERSIQLLGHIHSPAAQAHASPLLNTLDISLSDIALNMEVASQTSACRRFRAVRRLQRHIARAAIALGTTVDLMTLRYLCEQLSALTVICNSLSDLNTESLPIILLEIKRFRSHFQFFSRIIVFMLAVICFFSFLIVLLIGTAVGILFFTKFQ